MTPSLVKAHHKRSGMIMVLVMLAVSVAFVVGITFFATSTTAVRTADVLADHARSRQLAESGLALCTHYIERYEDWRTTRPQGSWIEDLSFGGGTVSVQASFVPEFPATAGLSDTGFETATESLATPLLNPPMSGVIGGWLVTRTALLPSGVTVPTIGTQASPNATDGANAAFVSFGAAVTGSGAFRQTMGRPLLPRATYEVSVDITTSTGLSNLTHEIRVYAGSAVVASSANAWTLSLLSNPGALPQPPTNPVDPDQYQALLAYAGLGPGSPTTFTLTFTTDNAPPSGNIAVELFAESTGIAASAWFDSVRFVERRNDPVTLTAIGRFKEASHIVTADVVRSFDGRAKCIRWEEP